MVEQFNTTYKPDHIMQEPTVPPTGEEQALFGNIIVEELQELAIAFDKNDKVEVFDAGLDIIYATAQQLQMWGFPVDAGLREVHRSNMSKLDDEGNPIIRKDGKVLKGSNYTSPDLAKVLNETQSS